MRRISDSLAVTLLAVTLLAVTLLAVTACGDDAGSGSGGYGGAPEETGQGDADWELVEIVSASAVGGRVSQRVAPIGTPAELRAFTAQFTRPDMRRQLREVRKGHTPESDSGLVAAVVWIGCETPTGVAYGDGAVTASPEPKETVQCLVPVTSVAVLDVEV